MGLEWVLYNNINKIFKYINNIKIFKKLELGDNNIKNWRQKCMDCVMGIFFLKNNTKVVVAFVAHGSSWHEGAADVSEWLLIAVPMISRDDMAQIG